MAAAHLRRDDAGGNDSPLGWARMFADVARELETGPGSGERLRRIAELATVVTGCPWSAIAKSTRTSRIAPVVAGGRDPDVGAYVGTLQATGGGPTWQAIESGTTVHVPDLAAETRWPEHVRQLLAHSPVRSVLAFCLRLDDRPPLGTLTLYGETADAFPSRTFQAATVYADHAAVALAYDSERVKAEHLELAVESNREISMGVGILIERFKITPGQAFDMMRVVSQHSHRKLREIAADLVHSGELDRTG